MANSSWFTLFSYFGKLSLRWKVVPWLLTGQTFSSSSSESSSESWSSSTNWSHFDPVVLIVWTGFLFLTFSGSNLGKLPAVLCFTLRVSKASNCSLGPTFSCVKDEKLVVSPWANSWREDFALVNTGFDWNLIACGCWKIWTLWDELLLILGWSFPCKSLS